MMWKKGLDHCLTNTAFLYFSLLEQGASHFQMFRREVSPANCKLYIPRRPQWRGFYRTGCLLQLVFSQTSVIGHFIYYLIYCSLLIFKLKL
jgi:hypothetical protein